MAGSLTFKTGTLLIVLLLLIAGAVGRFVIRTSHNFSENLSYENFERDFFPEWDYCDRGVEFLIEGEGCAQCTVPDYYDCYNHPIDGQGQMTVIARRTLPGKDPVSSLPVGQMLLKADFVNGRPEGPVELFYGHGQLAFSCPYSLGVRNGLCKSYSEQGTLLNETEYVEGERTGVFRAFRNASVLLSDGVAGECREYKEDGQTVYKFISDAKAKGGSCAYSYRETFREPRGIRRQEFLSLERDGTVSSTAIVWERFQDQDEKEIIARQRLVDGKLFSREQFFPEGKVIQIFDVSGALRRDSTYRLGQLDGLTRWYDEAGRLRRLGFYKANVPDGLFQWYDENGKVLWCAVYSKGELFGQRLFYGIMGWSITLLMMMVMFWASYPFYARIRQKFASRWVAYAAGALAALIIFVLCSYLASLVMMVMVF